MERILPSTLVLDLPKLVRGMNHIAQGAPDIVIHHAMLVGEVSVLDGQGPSLLRFVLAAEYAGLMVAYPRDIEEGLVERLIEIGGSLS